LLSKMGKLKKMTSEPQPGWRPFSLDELKNPDFWRSLTAEFIAMMIIVFLGIGGSDSAYRTFVLDDSRQEYSAYYIFIIFYLLLLKLFIMYSFGKISGAHSNPCVTISTFWTKRITILRLVGYFIVQLLGSCAGAALYLAATPPQLRVTDGIIAKLVISPDRAYYAFVMEFCITFCGMVTIYATAFDPRGWGTYGLVPLAVALIIELCFHAANWVSKGIMNTGRAFGPSVVHDQFTNQWVWWIGPLPGAILGGALYQYTFMNRQNAVTELPSLTGEIDEE